MTSYFLKYRELVTRFYDNYCSSYQFDIDVIELVTRFYDNYYNSYQFDIDVIELVTRFYASYLQQLLA